MTDSPATGSTGHGPSRWRRAVWFVLLPVMGAELIGIGYFAYQAWSEPKARLQAVLSGHTSPVRAVAFSPDSRTLAVVCENNQGKVWDVHTGKEQAAIRGLKDVVRIGEGRVVFEGGDLTLIGQAAFSPDGQTLATAGFRSPSVCLYDAATDKLRSTLVGHQWYVTAVAFSPDGRMLASACRGGSLRLWDVTTGEERGRLVGHRSPVSCMAYLPDGRSLITGSWDRTVRLWDAATRQNRSTISLKDRVEWVAVSPDGELFAVQTHKSGEFRDAKTGKVRATFPQEVHVSSGLFSPDGRTLATICNNRLDGNYEVKLWNVPPSAVTRNVVGNDGQRVARRCALRRDGERE